MLVGSGIALVGALLVAKFMPAPQQEYAERPEPSIAVEPAIKANHAPSPE